MRPFDDVADRLTERLKSDPELRAEVANELKGHMEASAREFLSAGRSEEAAWREAVRAIGDEREVAEGLWEGNRKRMTRRRVGRWVVGGTLLTAAGAGTVAVAWGAVVSIGVVLALFAGMSSTPAGAIGGTAAQRLAQYVRAEQVAKISPRDRAVFNAWQGSPEERAAKARALAESASGEDRKVFWANYATQMMVLYKEDAHGGKPHPGAMADAIAVMEEGKRVEPGNGYYALIESALLLDASTKMIDETEATQPGFTYTRPNGKPGRVSFDRFTVTDPATHARGIAQFHEAARAAYVESHVFDFSRRRLAALPLATRLADEVLRAEENIAILLPYLNDYRVAQNIIGAHAIELARAGKLSNALDIAHDERAVARQVVANSRSLIEMMVAVGMVATTLGHEAIAYQVAGDQTASAREVGEFERFMAEYARHGNNRPPMAQLKRQSGAVGGTLLPADVNPASIDPAPERRAEYAVADQLGASIWAGVLVTVGLTLLAGAAWSRLRTGRWPGAMFVGWKRLLQTIAVAVGAPVAIYALYASTIGGRGLGVNIGADRLAVEYAVIGAAMVILLRVLGERATGRRARQLGLPWEPTRWGTPHLATGGILAAAVLAYLILWHVLAANIYLFTTPTGGWGYMLAAVVTGYGLSWLTGMKPGVERRRPPRWIGPFLLTAAIVIAVVLLGGDYAYRTGRQVAEFAASASGVIAGLLAVTLVVRALTKPRNTATAGRLSYALSMGPLLLSAAVAMLLLAGLPARAIERHAVTRIEAAGGIMRLDREVEQSRYQAVRDKILAGAADR